MERYQKGLGHDPFAQVRHSINHDGYPKVLFIGDSYITKSDFDPDFILVNLGSNSVDDMDRLFKKHLKRSVNLQHTQTKIKKDFNHHLKVMKMQQVTLVKLIRKSYPTKRICYIPIKPRAWWSFNARCFASYLNHHFSRKAAPRCKIFHLKDLYINECKTLKYSTGYQDDVMSGFLDFDRVHFNNLGYSFITRRVMVPLAISLYSNRQ